MSKVPFLLVRLILIGFYCLWIVKRINIKPTNKKSISSNNKTKLKNKSLPMN